jgi:hypothetical protein
MIQPKDLSRIYFVSGCLSLLLSFWLAIHNVVINSDGLCYIRSAVTFAENHLREAMDLCGQTRMPFYSILIYSIQALSHLSYLNAAFVLNAALSLLSVLSFVSIIAFVGGGQRVLWFAALIILSWHDFNILREDLVRDHGFWAFYLLSLRLLLGYMSKPRFKEALLWFVSIALAALFRIEGFIFLVFLPLAGFFYQGEKFNQKLSRVFCLMTPLLLVGCFIFLFAEYSHHSIFHYNRLSDLQYEVMHGFRDIGFNFRQGTIDMQHVFNRYAVDDFDVLFILFILLWYVYSLAINLSWAYLPLMFYALQKHCLKLSPANRLAIMSYLMLGILITGLFMFQNLFISKRYLISVSLILLIWLPFALDQIWQKERRLAVLILVFISLWGLGSLISFGFSKDYIRQSGDWLAKYAPANAKIYSNDEMVMFYSNHFGNEIIEEGQTYQNVDMIKDGKWQGYDYLALRHAINDPEKNLQILREIHSPIVERFKNSRGDMVVIYRVSHEEHLS